jgi:hypothetical protein
VGGPARAARGDAAAASRARVSTGAWSSRSGNAYPPTPGPDGDAGSRRGSPTPTTCR